MVNLPYLVTIHGRVTCCSRDSRRVNEGGQIWGSGARNVHPLEVLVVLKVLLSSRGIGV
jgi:hypothetical protein